jgi:TolA-binding protein
METTSFILGMLTIVGVAAAILLVVGMVKIYKQKFMIANLQNQLDTVEQQSHIALEELRSQVYQNLDEIRRERDTLENVIHQNLDELRREYLSYVDSRIDKLQSKTNTEVVAN